jgi:predicted alpha/beta hydrolase family esterase
MKPTILLIHGAGPGSHRIMSTVWVPTIRAALPNHAVVCPEMPEPMFPQYAKWRAVLARELGKLRGAVILVGHSIGGTILLKYLTEEKIPNRILGLYLIASPYFSESGGWNYQDFFIRLDPDRLLHDFPVYSYHSTDDEIVPVSHQGLYARKFPQLVVRTLSEHGHRYDRKEFGEIIQDIRSLEHSGFWQSP